MSSAPIERNGDGPLNGVQKRVDEVEGFEPFKSLGTIATHAGHTPFDHEGIGCPIVPPITLSTTFQQREPGVAVSILEQLKLIKKHKKVANQVSVLIYTF